MKTPPHPHPFWTISIPILRWWSCRCSHTDHYPRPSFNNFLFPIYHMFSSQIFKISISFIWNNDVIWRKTYLRYKNDNLNTNNTMEVMPSEFKTILMLLSKLNQIIIFLGFFLMLSLSLVFSILVFIPGSNIFLSALRLLKYIYNNT